MPVVDRARLISVSEAWCFDIGFRHMISAPQSPFYQGPKPVGVLCSTYGNLRVFKYTADQVC